MNNTQMNSHDMSSTTMLPSYDIEIDTPGHLKEPFINNGQQDFIMSYNITNNQYSEYDLQVFEDMR